MIHRYLAMAVGVLIIAMTVIAWRRRLRAAPTRLRFSPWFPTALLGFVCLQGAFGAWTVTLKLQPVIVTLHLLLGMGLLALLAWHAMQQTRVNTKILPFPAKGVQNLKWTAAIALFLLIVQIALGGWVSTNYAALACTDFPLCDDTLVPQMDFANGFTLWRHLGKTADGAYLPFPALTAIHWVHRNFAFIVIGFVAWVGWNAARFTNMRKIGRWLLGVLAVQFLTGISTIFLKWPLALAVAHNGGAALLVALLVMVNYRAWRLRHHASHQSSPPRPYP